MLHDGANRVKELVSFACGQINQEVSIDYFATSLPNFPLFEDDLQERNRIDCLFLIGLAQLGPGRPGETEDAFRETLVLDPNHLEPQEEIRRILATHGPEDALDALGCNVKDEE